MRFDKFTAKLQAAIAELIEKADGSSSRLRDGLQRLVDDLPKVSQFDGEVQPSRDFVKLMNLTAGDEQCHHQADERGWTQP